MLTEQEYPVDCSKISVSSYFSVNIIVCVKKKRKQIFNICFFFSTHTIICLGNRKSACLRSSLSAPGQGTARCYIQGSKPSHQIIPII